MANEERLNQPSTEKISMRPVELLETSTAEHALSDDSSITAKIIFLFVLFGLGPSWLLSDGMFIQIPYWQRYQPEGLSLANKMTISGIMPLATLLPIYFIVINSINPTPFSFRKLIYALILSQIVSCILISIGWSWTIGNVSIMIHFVTYTSSLVGHMMVCSIHLCILSFDN